MNPEEQTPSTLRSRVAGLHPGVKVGAGVLALAILIGGASLIVGGNDHGPVAAPVVASSVGPSTPAKSPVASPSPKVAASNKASAKATTKASDKPSSNSDPAAETANGNGGGGDTAVGGTTGHESNANPAVAPPAPAPAYVAPAPAAQAAPQPAAPRPAPPAPAPAPKPVVVAPPVVAPPVQPPGRTEGINQSLGSINAHRIANGLAPFTTNTAGCHLAATVTGTALDSYQHQNVVLSRYDAAQFSKGVDWDTLSVYSC